MQHVAANTRALLPKEPASALSLPADSLSAALLVDCYPGETQCFLVLVFLKSTIVSFVLFTLKRRLLFPHRVTKWSVSVSGDDRTGSLRSVK